MARKEEIENELPKVWQNFMNKFFEIETLKISQWKEVHFLAYICKRFEQCFGRKFPLDMRYAPSKSPNIYFIKKMFAMLNTTDTRIIKEYIDWVWDEKIIPKKIKIRTLAFFLAPTVCNEFLYKRNEKLKPTRSTEIPPEYKSIAETLGVNVSTYGDLAFIKTAINQDNNNSYKEYKKLFMHLKSLGFEESILEQIA